MSAPNWLKPDGLDARGKIHWQTYATRLRKNGYLTDFNVEQFRTVCRLLALRDAVADDIGTRGPTIETKTGVIKPNPAVQILLRVTEQLGPLLQQFGLDNPRGTRPLEYSL